MLVEVGNGERKRPADAKKVWPSTRRLATVLGVTAEGQGDLSSMSIVNLTGHHTGRIIVIYTLYTGCILIIYDTNLGFGING